MHDAVRNVFQELVNTAPIKITDIEDRVTLAFAVEGLAEHGYASEFKSLAIGMVSYFASIREGLSSEATCAFTMKFGKPPSPYNLTMYWFIQMDAKHFAV
jgi:hypothetical protein